MALEFFIKMIGGSPDLLRGSDGFIYKRGKDNVFRVIPFSQRYPGRPHPNSPRPGFLRSDGKRDGAPQQPDSVQGQSRAPLAHGLPERRFGGAPEHPGRVGGAPARFPLPGGGGHFGR